MDHKLVTGHEDPHVYDSDALIDTAHEIAEIEIQHTRSVDLQYHRRSKILAIHDFFPRHATGDIFLVCGRLNETQRQITHIVAKDISHGALTKTVIARAAALFEKFGFSDLDVYIVPQGDLVEKPDAQRNFHFSISTDAEWNRLLTPQSDHSQIGHRKLDADRLLEVLNTSSHTKKSGHRRSENHAGAELAVVF